MPTLRTFLCAGAPIPGPLVEQALRAGRQGGLGLGHDRERRSHLTLKPDDGDERSVNTDGCPLPGVETGGGGSGRPRPALARFGPVAAARVLQFRRVSEAPSSTARMRDDRFDTGDLAPSTSAATCASRAAASDVIIRGGENIPVVEIESLLYKHFAIAMAAIVVPPTSAWASARLRRGGAPSPARASTPPAIVEFWKSQKVAPAVHPGKAGGQEGHARHAVRKDPEIQAARDAAAGCKAAPANPASQGVCSAGLAALDIQALQSRFPENRSWGRLYSAFDQFRHGSNSLRLQPRVGYA